MCITLILDLTTLSVNLCCPSAEEFVRKLYRAFSYYYQSTPLSPGTCHIQPAYHGRAPAVKLLPLPLILLIARLLTMCFFFFNLHLPHADLLFRSSGRGRCPKKDHLEHIVNFLIVLFLTIRFLNLQFIFPT